MLRLITPSLRALRTFGQAVWVLAATGWEMVVWGNVRAGSISLADTSRSFRTLVRLGLWLTVGLLGLLLFSQVTRRVSPLQPLLFNTDALAGNYIPVYFIPATLGLLALAWAYLLCGALHAHWTVKLLVLFLFGLFDLNFGLHLALGLFAEISLLAAGLGSSLWSGLGLLVQIGGWLALLVIFVIRWRRPIRLGLEFPLLLGLAAALLFSGYFGAQLSVSVFQNEAVSSGQQLTEALSFVGTLLIPFLLIAGVEVATFGMSLTEALAGRLRRAPQAQTGWGRRLWIAALVLFLCARLIGQWIIPLARGDGLAFSWGAVAIALLLLVIAARARSAAPAGELPGWVIPVAALAFYALLFLQQIAFFGVAGLGLAAVALGGEADTLVNAFSRWLLSVGEWNEVWVGGLALLTGAGLWLRARLRRQPLPAAALYLFIFSLWIVWWVLTRGGRPLEALLFHFEDFSTGLTPILLGLLLVGAAARRLTARPLLCLTAAALLLWLLELQGFLSNPLSPAFGLLGAQAALVSVGIFLNVMAAGNRFSLNAESRRFPRSARSLLYFGYALLTVVSINWLAASHNVSGLAANDQITQNGYLALGLPLAFWALIAGSDAVLGQPPPTPAETNFPA